MSRRAAIHVRIGVQNVIVIEGILTGVVVAVALAAAAWARRRWWPRGVSWMKSTRQGRRDERALRAAHRRRERAMTEAAAAGEVVVSNAVGTNPRRLRWTGAAEEETFHYQHHLDLVQARRREGRVPHLRAFCCGRSPRIGDRRRLPATAR